MTGSVLKVGEVLDLFTVEQPRWGATAVAGELGIAKSSAHELLKSMAAIGLLQRDGSGRYGLGWRPLELARMRMEAGRAAVPVARELAQHFGETVHVAARDRGRLVYLVSEKPDGGVGAPAGDVPLSATPIGQALESDDDVTVGAQEKIPGVTCAAARVADDVALGMCTPTERFERRGDEYARAVAGAGRRVRQ